MNLTDEQKKILEMAAQSMFSRIHFHEHENVRIAVAQQLCDLGLFKEFSFSDMVQERIERERIKRGRMFGITGQGIQAYNDILNASIKTDRYKNALEDVNDILNDWYVKGHEAVVNEAIKRIRKAMR